jgi:L-lactate permease
LVLARFVAPFALFVTILIGTHFFDDSKTYAGLTFPDMFGRIWLTIVDRFLWNVFDYASNLFSALILLEVMKRWGVVSAIRKEFTAISDDPNVLLTLVLFCFGLILAVVAPGKKKIIICKRLSFP